MSSVSGSILSFTINGRNFSVAANSDTKLSLGGRENFLERNGDGKTSRLLWRYANWAVAGLEIVIDHDRDDLQFLASLRDTEIAGHLGRINNGIEIELVDGMVYVGRGIPVGRIEVSTMSGTAIVDFEGDGELTPARTLEFLPTVGEFLTR